MGIWIGSPATAVSAARWTTWAVVGSSTFVTVSGPRPLLWVSGQLPLGPDGTLEDRHKGKLGPDSSIELAREAAQRCTINILAQAQAALGDLDKVVRVVRLGGFFNVASSFDPLPLAMNGASDLMAEVFGERGRHTRTTVGVAHLPMNALAEVDAVFEVST